MEFRILGPIEAEEDGLKLDLGGLRERALLARFLLSANRVVSAYRLADESRPGRQCFVLIEGKATVEAAGNRLRELGAGSFVGLVDADGRPLPLAGLTVQLATHSRVLVIDARRLAVLIDSDPAAAAAWRKMSQQA